MYNCQVSQIDGYTVTLQDEMVVRLWTDEILKFILAYLTYSKRVIYNAQLDKMLSLQNSFVIFYKGLWYHFEIYTCHFYFVLHVLHVYCVYTAY